MKKSLLVLSAFLSIAAVRAQEVSWGVKAGLNIASMEIPGDDVGSKAGLHIGGLAHIHVASKFAVQPELYFSMQGGKEGDVTFNYNYINLPVLAQYMTGSGFRIQTGPQLGFLVSANRETDNDDIDDKDFRKGTDFAWVFGAGYQFASGFGVDARYNLGLTSINEDEDFDIKNRVFQIGVFYQFLRNTRTRK